MHVQRILDGFMKRVLVKCSRGDFNYYITTRGHLYRKCSEMNCWFGLHALDDSNVTNDAGNRSSCSSFDAPFSRVQLFLIN
jgi:hypothetical protein